jgi:CSLREA domain-containing protein
MRRRSVSALAAILVWSIAGPAHLAATSTIVVNTTADELNSDGDCSLREAITAANTDAAVDACGAGAGADTITFAGLGFNAINLLSTLPIVTSDVTIDGATQVRPINAGAAPAPTRILENAGSLILRHVQLFNGSAQHGGAILNDAGATLLIEDSRFDGNGPAEFGGAIYNAGTLTIRRSEFDGNHAQAAPFLGIASAGGALFNTGTLTVEASSFRANQAYRTGGAISGGGSMTIRNSTFSGNDGGNFGGAIASNGTLDIEATTIGANFAAIGGGGVDVTDSSSDTTIGGSVLSNNSRGDCVGAITDAGYNVVSDGSCITASSSIHADAQLDFSSLANGGPTLTLPIKAGGPAVDAIPDGVLGCGSTLATDQRGVGRPQAGACDIGAFERTPDTVAPESELDAVPAEDLTDHHGWYTYDPAFRISATDPRPVLIDHPSGVAETRCVINPAAQPTGFEDLSAACPLAGSGTHLADGVYHVSYASRDIAGNIEAIRTGTLDVDATLPTVACPTSLPMFLRGAAGASLTGTVTDATSGPASATTSAQVSTATIGPTEVDLIGQDNAANFGVAVCYPIVQYAVTYLSPADGPIRAGSWIQVEVALSDALVARISDAEGTQLANGCAVRMALDAGDSTGNCASYSAKRDTFGFRLRTAKTMGPGPHTVHVQVWVGGVLINDASTVIQVRG